MEPQPILPPCYPCMRPQSNVVFISAGSVRCEKLWFELWKTLGGWASLCLVSRVGVSLSLCYFQKRQRAWAQRCHGKRFRRAESIPWFWDLRKIFTRALKGGWVPWHRCAQARCAQFRGVGCPLNLNLETLRLQFHNFKKSEKRQNPKMALPLHKRGRWTWGWGGRPLALNATCTQTFKLCFNGVITSIFQCSEISYFKLQSIAITMKPPLLHLVVM